MDAEARVAEAPQHLRSSQLQAHVQEHHRYVTTHLGGNSYGNVAVSDHAHAVVGDQYTYGDSTFNIDQATFTSGHGPSDDEIAAWLAPANFLAYQNDTFARVHPGTGEWFLKSDEYHQWLSSQGNDKLVLSGIPGAGKTFLSSIIVNDLRGRFDTQEDVQVLFLYNSFNQIHNQTTQKMLATLVRQSFQHDTSKGAKVRQLYKHHHRKGRKSQPVLEELVDCLRVLLYASTHAFFVFDALDECISADADRLNQRNQFLSLLDSLQKESPGKISVLTTSRPIHDDLDLLSDSHTLQISAHQQDIASFVDMQFSKSSKRMFKNTTLRREIQHAVVEACDGMFLLAKLLVDTILTQTKPNMVRKFVNDMLHASNALQMTYENTLQRIKGGPRADLAAKVLACVVFSKLPLSMQQLRHAVAVEPGMTDITEDDLDEEQDLLSACASLVVFDPERNVVRLVHYTTLDYFTDLMDSWFDPYKTFLLEACMTYLTIPKVKVHALRCFSRVSDTEQYPLTVYALVHLSVERPQSVSFILERNIQEQYRVQSDLLQLGPPASSVTEWASYESCPLARDYMLQLPKDSHKFVFEIRLGAGQHEFSRLHFFEGKKLDDTT